MKTLISHIILMLHCVFIAEISAVLPAAPTGKTWELVPSMSDEFNYTGMPSSSGKWTDNNPNGWSGRWPGLFMDSQVWVNGTDLTITAEPHNDTGWTIKTGYIATHTKIKYPVYFECSMKASDLSMASSFWMKLGDQGNYSEIDVTETYGHPTATSSWYQNDVPYFMRCNTHYHDQNEGANYSTKNLSAGNPLKGVKMRDAYHTLGCWWRDKRNVSFYLDDEWVGDVVTPGDFEENLSVIFDMEPFQWPGWPTTESLLDPTKNTMYVDWVHTYELVDGITEQSPYGGSPRLIPGRIEVEEYDLGGEGLAYHDTTAGNSGEVFRNDDVDIEALDEGFTAGWIADGEWLEYTVNALTGIYELTARVASENADSSFAVFLDETQIATVNVPNTGDWGTFVEVIVPDVAITDAENAILRIEFSCPNDGQNLNWIEFVSEIDPPTPNPAQWDIEPYAVDGTTISMTAIEGTDAISPPVEYSFEETSGNPGGSDSGWQISPEYTNTDLDPATSYTYTVRMRDHVQNETIASVEATACTRPDIDIVNDGIIDELDLAALCSRWLDTDCCLDALCGGSDLDASGRVDMGDFEILSAHWLELLGPSIVTLDYFPTDDAYLENGTPFNNTQLKVEDGRRVSYLKFDIADIPAGYNVTSVTLQLTENGDVGSGTLRFYLGSHNNWTETTITSATAPAAGTEVGSNTGGVSAGQTITVDVTPFVTENGIVSMVVMMDAGGNDIWFASKEAAGKEPVLTVIVER